MQTYQLTKADWKKLENANLTDGGIGNGFANTTDHFDNNILCSKHRPTFIVIKNTIFIVQYYSGCFYPCWLKVYDDLSKADYFIQVGKNNELTRIDNRRG